MNENQLQLLFESVRSVPTEMSLKQVSNTVSSFPAVIRKPWYTKINLNTFLMTSSLIVITAVAIFFSSPNQTSDNSSESQQIVEIERLDISDRKLSLINPKLPNDIILTSPERDSIFFYEDLLNSEIKDSIPSDTVTFNELNAMYERPHFVSDKEIEEKDIILNTEQAKRLQKTLEGWVKKDDLGSWRNGVIKVQYHPEYLIINSDTLNGAILNKYRNLLFQYSITPGNNRHIFSSRKYIMAGDFTDGNFRGSVLGKLMRIKITNRPGYIKQGGSEKRKVILHITDFEPTNQKYRDAAFIDTKREGQSEGLQSNSAPIDKSRLKELHSDIVSLFKSYDFKTKGHFKYSISFDQSTLELRQRTLNLNQQRELINLLANHSIHLKNDRLLVLNDYGIMLIDHAVPEKNIFQSWIKTGHIFKVTGSDLRELEKSFLRDN